MDRKTREKYAKEIKQQVKKAKAIYVENPFEIIESILGLELTDFLVLTGEEAYCAEEEIFLEFEGKEMRIYIDPRTKKLTVYTD